MLNKSPCITYLILLLVNGILECIIEIVFVELGRLLIGNRIIIINKYNHALNTLQNSNTFNNNMNEYKFKMNTQYS